MQKQTWIAAKVSATPIKCHSVLFCFFVAALLCLREQRSSYLSWYFKQPSYPLFSNGLPVCTVCLPNQQKVLGNNKDTWLHCHSRLSIQKVLFFLVSAVFLHSHSMQSLTGGRDSSPSPRLRLTVWQKDFTRLCRIMCHFFWGLNFHDFAQVFAKTWPGDHMTAATLHSDSDSANTLVVLPLLPPARWATARRAPTPPARGTWPIRTARGARWSRQLASPPSTPSTAETSSGAWPLARRCRRSRVAA